MQTSRSILVGKGNKHDGRVENGETGNMVFIHRGRKMSQARRRENEMKREKQTDRKMK